MSRLNISKENDIVQLNEIITSAVDSEKEIRITSYTLSDAIEREIAVILKHILEKYDKYELFSTILTCVKEVITNGTKANMKGIFFKKNKLHMGIKDEYDQGMKAFKKSFSKEWFVKIGVNARKLRLYVRTIIKYSENGIQIDIYNNTPIKDVDVKRIVEKLKNAEQCDNLVEYYMKYHDGTEGAGIGFALIIFSYKGKNIDTRNFRLYLNNLNYLCASLNFPYEEGYIYPLRENDYKLIY